MRGTGGSVARGPDLCYNARVIRNGKRGDTVSLWDAFLAFLYLGIDTAICWGVGFLGHAILSFAQTPLFHIRNGKWSPVAVDLCFTAVTAAAAAVLFFVRGVDVHELLGWLVPAEDLPGLVRVVMDDAFLDGLRSHQTFVLIQSFISGKILCVAVGAGLINLVRSLVCRLLCDRRQKEPSGRLRRLGLYAAGMAGSISAIVIALAFAEEIRLALGWVITLGTMDSSIFDGNIFFGFKILFAIYALLAGSVLFSLIMWEIMENGLLIAAVGSAFSLAVLQPSFTRLTLWGYVGLVFFIGFLLDQLISPREMVDDDVESLYTSYLVGGMKLVMGILLSLVLCGVYIRFLAA